MKEPPAPTPESKEFAEAVRRGLRTFDRSSLDWVASGFAWEKLLHSPRFDQTIDSVLARNPRGPADVLGMGPSSGPFECYAMAALIAHCGLGADVTLEGPPTGTIVVAGDATIRGPLVVSTDDWVMVTGTLTADAIVSAADVIVGGSVVARDGVLGFNGWEQSLWIAGKIEAPLLVTYEYMHTVGDATGVRQSLDAEANSDFAARLAELLAAGLADEILARISQRGPDGAIQLLAARLANGQKLR